MEPDTVRIYPVAVLRGTALHRLWQQGLYTPPTLEEAVELGAWALGAYHRAGVRVIRMGLHDSSDVRQSAAAGVCHPAFRELCESRVMLASALEQLSERPAGRYTLAVAAGATSKMVGQRRCNLLALGQRGYEISVREDAVLEYLNVRVE